MPLPVEMSFRRTPVTLVLLAVMIALEMYCAWYGAETRNKLYNDYLGATFFIWDYQWWRPLTSTLIHVDPIHASMNLLMFAVFGASLEFWLRPLRLLGVIVFLAYVSSLPEFVISNFFWEYPNSPHAAAGFSGVGYGLFGLMLIARKYRPEFYQVCTPLVVQVMVAWFFLCIVLTVLDVFPVANFAHGAGWLFGALLAKAIYSVRKKWLWRSIFIAASLAVLSSMFYGWNHPGYLWLQKYKQQREAWRGLELPDFPVQENPVQENQTDRAP